MFSGEKSRTTKARVCAHHRVSVVVTLGILCWLQPKGNRKKSSPSLRGVGGSLSFLIYLMNMTRLIVRPRCWSALWFLWHSKKQGGFLFLKNLVKILNRNLKSQNDSLNKWISSSSIVASFFFYRQGRHCYVWPYIEWLTMLWCNQISWPTFDYQRRPFVTSSNREE